MKKFFDKTRRAKNGCLLWIGAKNPDGYGNLTVAGKARKAHRFAWEAKHGVIPSGLCVLHRCDNPACVNTDHLFLGTQADNIRDCVTKGRYNRPTGARHWQRKNPGRYAGKNNPNFRHGGYING